ncbi:MAG: NADH-quinone oxidoreductase subunit NuoF [Candidatus Omnitrophica bacterium]|nr:NADH-quinone oxidoreductase subunit NuoF [Candidatus Omnitrophota bacterium]
MKRILIQDTDGNKKKDLRDFAVALTSQLRERNLDGQCQVVTVADLGVYNKGLAARVLPEGFIYKNLEIKNITEIIDKTIIAGQKIDALAFDKKSKQMRVVLRNCGVVDPESFDEYVGNDGYQGLVRALEMGPEQAIAEMKKSGLRGRGGAGFPTWLKWDITRKVSGDVKYIICNGDEGDPGAYMDRSVLEGDPHSVIEGMMIGGFAVGATYGFFYIRAEYPLAVERIQKAINKCYEKGLLGKNILGSNFNFDMEIRLGAGAFVCGEETALIASVEGLRGYPRPRPPFPSVKGLWDKPTVINNVETLANIPYIFAKGGEEFGKIGTEGSKGTKVFAVTGKVRNSGLVEVPMGITLREIVFDIGGGVFENKAIKAIQTGGPSGGVIPEQYFDTPVEYESLQKLGSIMGSGGMIVMDEDDCMVDISKFYLGFCVDESCGKCAPCRIGGTQMLGILTRISEGKGKADDLNKLNQIALAMQKASLCGLGQTAPNPVLSTLKYFAEEYRAHVEDGKCPSGKCASLVSFLIHKDKCTGCGLCARNCPVNVIAGSRQEKYVIDQEKCISCGMCYQVCKFDAVERQ